MPHCTLNLFFLKQASQIAALLRLALINTVSKKQLCFIETNQIKDVFLIIVVKEDDECTLYYKAIVTLG